jgi:hypothetical protein
MSEKLSIKINIANRLYPMKVNKEFSGSNDIASIF